MRTILQTKILNPYRHRIPKWYNAHTGTDHDYKYEELPSPITGKVVALTHQVQMGNCLYLEDHVTGDIHVFAHLKEFRKNVGDQVVRNDILAITGNTGTITSGPHLHYEIITKSPVNKIDWLMRRKLLGFKGFNTDPSIYIKKRWHQYNIGIDGNVLK